MFQHIIDKLKSDVARLNRLSLEIPGMRNECNAKAAPMLELVRRLAAIQQKSK